ncbi:MAG TPA: GTPase [Pseudoduganella sp.]|jgi:hypothetical protein
MTTLVTGRRAFDRETSIAAQLAGMAAPAAASGRLLSDTLPSDSSGSDTAGLAAHAPVAVISEGLADPNTPLADWPHVQVLRIAPGCLCCAGNVVLRVTLNRLLRRPPAQLFISLADATHVGQLRAMLSAPPYDTLLSLCDDVAAPAIAS